MAMGQQRSHLDHRLLRVAPSTVGILGIDTAVWLRVAGTAMPRGTLMVVWPGRIETIWFMRLV
jgi:hypothetical protein